MDFTGRISKVLAAVAISAGMAIGLSSLAMAQSNDELMRRIEALESQLGKMQGMKQELESLKSELSKTQATAAKAEREALAEQNTKIKWHLGGYADANYATSTSDSKNDSFASGEFNPIFLINYDDLLVWESELEFKTRSNASTKTELEFANLNLLATDWLTFTAGKFLSPVGDFQQHLHPAWVNKMVDRPAGFVEDGGNLPLNHIGAMLHGAFPVGSMTAEYALYAANGPRLDDTASAAVKQEGVGGDDNGDKAIGGRIGLRPLPYVSIGFSGLRANVNGNPGTGGFVSQGGFDLQDVDAAFTYGSWDIRGEWVRSHLGPMSTALETDQAPQAVKQTIWRSWYAQVAYRLAGVTNNPILSNFEPVARYSQLSVTGNTAYKVNEEDRWSIGLDYWFAPSIVAKVMFENRDFHAAQDEEVGRFQFVFGF